MWCWTDGCLLSRLQQRGNVIPAWIVVISHWTKVSLSTARDCPGISVGVSASYTVTECLAKAPLPDV